jgi:hypothetical protein
LFYLFISHAITVTSGADGCNWGLNVPQKTLSRLVIVIDRDVFDLEGGAQYLGPGFNRRWLRENCVRLCIEHVLIGNSDPPIELCRLFADRTR